MKVSRVETSQIGPLKRGREAVTSGNIAGGTAPITGDRHSLILLALEIWLAKLDRGWNWPSLARTARETNPTPSRNTTAMSSRPLSPAGNSRGGRTFSGSLRQNSFLNGTRMDDGRVSSDSRNETIAHHRNGKQISPNRAPSVRSRETIAPDEQQQLTQRPARSMRGRARRRGEWTGRENFSFW
jgi:hypothetical protein